MMFDSEVFGYVLVALFILMMLGYFTRFFGKYFKGRLRPLLYLIWAAGIAFILIGLLDPLGPGSRRVGNKARVVMAGHDLTQIVTALKAYEKEYGTMQAGTNAEIVTALRGRNPKGIAFLALPPRSVNVQKEFVDLWQHPYRIDTSNPAFPWAYSFGPDGKDDGGAAGADDVTSW